MEIGITHTNTHIVEPGMTASALKSGALDVFATPIMIAYMENCCMECAAPFLPDTQGTVGTLVNVTHEAPTPVGMTVTVQCVLKEIDRRRLVFSVVASDEEGIIGRGIHERFIVDNEQFVAKCLSRGK